MSSSTLSSPKPSDDAPPGPSSHAPAPAPDHPPELPPRPPTLLSLSPRPRHAAPPPPHAPAYQSPTTPHPVNTPGVAVGSGGGGAAHTCGRGPWYSVLFQKYVLLTVISGGLSVILGSLFITIYFIVRNTTTSLHYFETLPTYIPGVTLVVTGLTVTLFSKTSHRRGWLVKLSGCLCLVSALLCVVVTVTTTVVHMNRLQTLRECVYQASTRTCTCFAGIVDHRSLDHDTAALRYVFALAPSCEVIHGTIYTCLRAMFGLSVIGILVSIFSCMLVYQILSHEKKKKYLAELNTRCRSLYQRPGLGQSGLSQYGAQMCQYPWLLNNRLCSGNLYTPTPELSISTLSTLVGGAATPLQLGPAPAPATSSSGAGAGTPGGGAWRWLPWGRKQTGATPSNTPPAGASGLVHSASEQQVRSRVPGSRHPAPPHWRYSHSDAVYGFRPPASSLASTLSSYNMGHLGQARLDLRDLQNLDSLSNLLWGPPPPYSQPSPASDPQLGTEAALSPASSQAASPGRSQSRVSRTTKSGILTENTDTSATSTSGSPVHYDDTVDSAMHIYEKLRRSRSGSLPSRRVKKSRRAAAAASAHDLATAESARQQQLSALNLSRAEELRTARDLEEIKRALVALQQNSLGILSNIQYDSSVYGKGSSLAQADFQQQQFSQQRQDSVPAPAPAAKPAGPHKQKKARSAAVFPECGQVAGRGGRRTTSTTNLLGSGTDSDHSYSRASTQSSSGSRTSSSLSSPTNLALSPYFTNQLQQKTKHQLNTAALPQINSSIIQTANQRLLCGGQGGHVPSLGSRAGPGHVSSVLSGLLSPRHAPAPPPPPELVTGLISPARMMPSTFTPPAQVQQAPSKVQPSPIHLQNSPVQMKNSPVQIQNSPIHAQNSPVKLQNSPVKVVTPPGKVGTPPAQGLVYLRQDQNIPSSFCDKFRPIQPASSAAGAGAGEEAEVRNISSDDIVVTLHSVNV